MVFGYHVSHHITLFAGYRLGGQYLDCFEQFIVKIIEIDLLCNEAAHLKKSNLS